MRILHVITDLRTGGAEKLMVDLLPKFREKGHKVELCVFNSEETPFLGSIRNAGIPIHSFGDKRDYYNPGHLLKLIKLCRNFDIVHTHNTAPQLFGAIASLTSKVRWILTEHTTTSHHRTWWYRPIEKWMYGRYNHIICISDAVKQSMLEVTGDNNKNITVIPNGIDSDRFHNAQSINKFSIGSSEPEKKVILMVGRFSYQKDQATIIRAISLLPQNVELWLAGYGDTEEMLSNLATELNISNRVHLLGMRSDVPNLLKASDIVVQSSHIEGFGLAAVEAMAAGKPIIATDIPGLRDVVNGAGMLFKHEDYHQLSDLISELLKNHELYGRLVTHGYQRSKQYSLDKMIDRYHHVYTNIDIPS